jgi:acyl carrier protein
LRVRAAGQAAHLNEAPSALYKSGLIGWAAGLHGPRSAAVDGRMNKSEIWDKATTIFRETLDVDGLVLTPELTARDVERWDSFNHILLVVAVEQAFGIKFDTGEIDGLENVGQFMDVIERKVSA